MLIRYIDLRNLESGSFKDITTNDWYYYDIASAKNKNIFKGIGNGYFEPLNPITRQDVAVILAQTLKTLQIPIQSYNASILR